jgi:hypothetical protein
VAASAFRIELAPGFQEAGDIGNYFVPLVFFGFLAMSKSSDVGPADQAPEPVSENPARSPFSYTSRGLSPQLLSVKIVYFSKA